ncbi:MAG: DUF4199 domain-containing protein [Bacteroides sp.]|nr:DUF4199 domain-containing protein [Bacteroides sp.]
MKKSIYRYAAEAGFPIGIYLSVMAACMLMGLKYEFLTSFLLPLTIAFPFLLGVILRQIAKKEPAYMKVSALWLGGIYTMIFGTIICMLFSACYIFFADPGFVYEYVSSAIDSIESSPMKEQYANTTAIMREAIEARILPSGIEFVATMGWSTCFFGSILSLIVAAIIVKINKRKQRNKIDAFNL